MKRMLFAGVFGVGLLLLATGCEPEDLSADAKAILSAQALDPSVQGDQLRAQDQLRLHEAACTADGNEYRYMYGGENGGTSGQAGNGQRAGDQTRLQLRDGSCGDGG